MPSDTNASLAATAAAEIQKAWMAGFDKSARPVVGIAARQKASLEDRGPSSRLNTVPVTFSAPPGHGLRDAVLDAVKALGDEGMVLPELEAADVVAEWVAVKPPGASERGGMEMGARERLERLSKGVKGRATILFVHGGAFYQNGLGRARPSAARLSKEANARVLVVDYRLAPQAAFPSQILDVLITYLSLLYPPPGSAHDPVDASSIVLAGESSGATIILGFVQLLLHLQTCPINFHGNPIPNPVPMPSGLALPSLQAELAYIFPSWLTNQRFDVFPPDLVNGPPFHDPDFVSDAIWPSTPPRETLYCPASLYAHPMVAPCAAKTWRGAPPMYLPLGQECLADSIAVVAQAAIRDGVTVVWEQYQCMPHCWMVVMPRFPQAEHLWRRWGEMCRVMVDGKLTESKGVWIEVEQLSESEMDLRNISGFSWEQVVDMTEAKAREAKVFVGARGKANL